MSRLFKSALDLSSSESDNEESSSEIPNFTRTSISSEPKKAPDVNALIKELQDILKAESATDSYSQNEARCLLEYNELKEDTIKEYNFKAKPAITNIKEVKLTPKNWRNTVKVNESENFSNLKKKYFDELNDFINKWRFQERGIALNTIRTSNFPYAFSDVMSAISTELIKADVKPLLLLKVLDYFFSNFETLVAKNPTLKTKCILSLKKFVTNSLKCEASKYLLKDIAVDILSDFGCVSLTSAATKLFAHKFRYLQEFREDLYGTTVAWLCNVTTETAVKLLQRESDFSDTLVIRALNSPNILSRLILVCESNVCCSSDELESLSLRERINVLNQSEGVSQMTIDCVHAQEVNVSLVKRKQLYDRSLVKNVDDLIRYESIYTPVFYFKYNSRTPKPYNFLDVMIEKMRKRYLPTTPKKYLHMSARESQAAYVKGLTEESQTTDSPQNFFVTEPKESYVNDSSFWSSWDIFSGIETSVDKQLVYFGQPSENLEFDPNSREKANTYQVSTLISDMNPMNIKSGPNVFDCFKMPDSLASFQSKKKKRKNIPL